MDNKIKISAMVNTYNEGKYIRECLEHLKWVDEIVVVDMYSTDNTIKIVQEYTDKIYFHKREMSALYARNFGISKTTGEWILVIDPDEIVPETLAQKILQLINSDWSNEYVACAFPYKEIIFNKWLKYTYPVEWHPRLFKRGHVFQPHRVHSQPVIDGKVYSLPAKDEFCIIHNRCETIERFIKKMNRYTTEEACYMYTNDGIKFSMYDLFEKPVSEFIHRYFLRQGYRDGIEGFVFSVLISLYRFCTYLKLWEISQKMRHRNLQTKNG